MYRELKSNKYFCLRHIYQQKSFNFVANLKNPKTHGFSVDNSESVRSDIFESVVVLMQHYGLNVVFDVPRIET